MWVSKRKWQELEKRVADLEKEFQSQQVSKNLSLDERIRKLECLNLAIKLRLPLDAVKENYDTLVKQCREAGIV